MQRYQNVVLNENGVPVQTPTVTVRVANTTPNSGASATLFSDNLASPTSLTNPLTGDANGNFFFYVVDGRYDIALTGGTPTIPTTTIADIEIADTGFQPTITFTSTDATPSIRLGNVFNTAGTTAITAFDGGVDGQKIHIIATASITITDGAGLNLNGAVNYAMTITDTLTLVNDGSAWYELARSVN